MHAYIHTYTLCLAKDIALSQRLADYYNPSIILHFRSHQISDVTDVLPPNHKNTIFN